MKGKHMDVSETISPKSDQLAYEDLLAGPRTLTIASVDRGPSAEQPVNIFFQGVDRPWRPAKTVRRLLVACWGKESGDYIGRRITLFGDPTVRWAGAEVGGIRFSHASHIDHPVVVSLSTSKGKRAPFTVQPLPDTDPHITTLTTAGTLYALKTAWENLPATVRSRPDVVAAKNTRKTELESDPSTKEN